MNLVKNTYIQGGLVQATRPIPPENYKVHIKSNLASIHQHVGEHPMTTSPNLRRLSLKVISRSTSESQMDRPELHCIFKFYTKPRPYLTIHTTFPLHFFYGFFKVNFSLPLEHTQYTHVAHQMKAFDMLCAKQIINKT
uniref:Uncharacterized protein n=1 Tax=Cacopsylla melanoneura TaxID=428564 RepID=A0A8D8Z412_9HEMI